MLIWKPTKEAKRHIAGEVVDGIQKCTRCKTVLNRGVYSAAIWKAGREIIQNRHGVGIASSYSNAVDIRPCGRKGE